VASAAEDIAGDAGGESMDCLENHRMSAWRESCQRGSDGVKGRSGGVKDLKRRNRIYWVGSFVVGFVSGLIGIAVAVMFGLNAWWP